MITRILLALIYVQNSITMPHLAVIQLMRVIKWPRSDSDGSCVNKKGRGYKGFYSILPNDAQSGQKQPDNFDKILQHNPRK